MAEPLGSGPRGRTLDYGQGCVFEGDTGTSTPFSLLLLFGQHEVNSLSHNVLKLLQAQRQYR